VEAWLERQTILNADKIILTSDRMQVDLHRRYPASSAKTEVLLNGYDPLDFDDTVTPRIRSQRQRFTLTHAGTLYYNRTAEEFLLSLSRLINSGAIPRARIRVNFIGLSPNVMEQSRRLGIDDVVTVVDPMTYRDCIDALRLSDALLLFAQGQPLQIPTKFYDYIAVSKPVLVFAEDGATVDLANTLESSIVIPPGNTERLEAALQRLYSQFAHRPREGTGANTRALQRGLTKVELTRRLAELIN